MWMCCQINDLVWVLTWTHLFSACFCRKDDMEAAQMLLSQAKKDGAAPTLIMCRCIIGEHCRILSDLSIIFLLALKKYVVPSVIFAFTSPRLELRYHKTIVSLSDVCKYIEIEVIFNVRLFLS